MAPYKWILGFLNGLENDLFPVYKPGIKFALHKQLYFQLISIWVDNKCGVVIDSIVWTWAWCAIVTTPVL